MCKHNFVQGRILEVKQGNASLISTTSRNKRQTNRNRKPSPNVMEMENLKEDSEWGGYFHNPVYNCTPFLFDILITLEALFNK